MTWWAWYSAGLVTLPALFGLWLLYDELEARCYGWQCNKCGMNWHWVDSDGRLIPYVLSQKWHDRFKCTEAGDPR